MKTPSIKLHTYTQGVFVVLLQVVIFLTTFFITTKTFAQEQVLETKTSQTEVNEISISESILDTETQEVSETKVVESISKTIEPVLTKKQQKQLKKLDKQLKKGKITQEEYDKKKAEITGVDVRPIEPELEMAIMARSANIEPEAQTLGKYIAPQVSTTNGSLNYEYPIVVPAGRNGLTPDISLNYNSGNKSHSSLVGTGWSFNISYIQRINKKGVNNLYTENHFTSSLDGELIDQGNGTYTPRTENGNFLKYEFSNDVWTITDKEGTVYKLGETTQARQDNPPDFHDKNK